MPLVIPPGFAMFDLTIVHVNYARAAHVTFGTEVSGLSLNPVELANRIQTHNTAELRDLLDSEATITQVECRLGQDAPDPLVGVNNNGLSPGLRSGATVAPNVAVLVHKRSAVGGRRNRGRMYLPWYVPDGDVDELGALSSAEVNACQVTLSAYRAAIEADANLGSMVILHDSSKYTVTRPSPTVKQITRTTVVTPSPTVVTALVVDPRVATQRRRMGR